MDDEEVTSALLDALRERRASLATAESLTGGLLASWVTDVPGASAVFVGGLVTYATAMKQDLLGVPDELVAEHGVVSEACAVAMAQGARRVTGATYALSTTGVAGPDEQEGHPAGTVFVGVSGPGVERAVRLSLAGTRRQVREGTCREAVSVLRGILTG